MHAVANLNSSYMVENIPLKVVQLKQVARRARTGTRKDHAGVAASLKPTGFHFNATRS